MTCTRRGVQGEEEIKKQTERLNIEPDTSTWGWRWGVKTETCGY